MEITDIMLPCTKHTGVGRRFDGFTLIELMVTIVILGILASVAAPSFSGLLASQRVRGVASELYMGLIKTRSEAIKRNASVTLSQKSSGWAASGWQILDPAGSATPLDDHGPVTGVIITGPVSVTYQSSGRIPVAATVKIQVESSVVSTVIRCVSVDPSGRPNVKASSC